jgi:hypothetical protein
VECHRVRRADWRLPAAAPRHGQRGAQRGVWGCPAGRHRGHWHYDNQAHGAAAAAHDGRHADAEPSGAGTDDGTSSVNSAAGDAPRVGVCGPVAGRRRGQRLAVIHIAQRSSRRQGCLRRRRVAEWAMGWWGRGGTQGCTTARLHGAAAHARLWQRRRQRRQHVSMMTLVRVVSCIWCRLAKSVLHTAEQCTQDRADISSLHPTHVTHHGVGAAWAGVQRAGCSGASRPARGKNGRPRPRHS